VKIGVLGTGPVGRALSSKFITLGHDVMMGTRDVADLLKRNDPLLPGRQPFRSWFEQNVQVRLGTFAEAAAFAEILFNATDGSGSVAALAQAGEENIGNKILIDVANPLDYSQRPPVLAIANTDSLGERVQRLLPNARVVKTLNTTNVLIMVNPGLVPGDHDVFIGGNDAGAKAQVTDILVDWFGWKNVIDLGDITSARATEMLYLMWLRVHVTLGTPVFNFHVEK
jgi:predicted dinucleotide-binding enzyme